MKRKVLIVVLLASLFCGTLSAQRFAIKTNILYDVALVPSLGVEMGLGQRWTLDISGTYNPFTYQDCKFWRNFTVSPEVRFWTCESFNGFFVGLHAIGGQYSFTGFKVPFVKGMEEKRRYEAWSYGGGLTVGYQWVLSKRWSVEAALGGGYSRILYEKYEDCDPCSKIMNPDKKDQKTDYWGPTKASVALMFFF